MVKAAADWLVDLTRQRGDNTLKVDVAIRNYLLMAQGDKDAARRSLLTAFDEGMPLEGELAKYIRGSLAPTSDEASLAPAVVERRRPTPERSPSR